MSRFPNLQHTILAALAAAGVSCSCPDGDVERDYTFNSADSAYSELVTRCLEDDLSCSELCMALLSPDEREYEDPSVIECRLNLNEANKQAHVQATYIFPVDCGGAGRRPSGAVACTRIAATSRWSACSSSGRRTT